MSMRSIILCSLEEYHVHSLAWALLARSKCPQKVAASIVKAADRTPYLPQLLNELVTEPIEEVKKRGTPTFVQFWKHLRNLRRFRNNFIHKSPLEHDAEPEKIARRLLTVANEVERNMERSFMELTNSLLGKVKSP